MQPWFETHGFFGWNKKNIRGCGNNTDLRPACGVQKSMEFPSWHLVIWENTSSQDWHTKIVSLLAKIPGLLPFQYFSELQSPYRFVRNRVPLQNLHEYQWIILWYNVPKVGHWQLHNHTPLLLATNRWRQVWPRFLSSRSLKAYDVKDWFLECRGNQFWILSYHCFMMFYPPVVWHNYRNGRFSSMIFPLRIVIFQCANFKKNPHICIPPSVFICPIVSHQIPTNPMISL